MSLSYALQAYRSSRFGAKAPWLPSKMAQGTMEVTILLIHFVVCTNNAVYNLAASPTTANFTSPYYDERYPQNASCGWKIEAPPGKIVKLQFKTASVDDDDPIMVYDGEAENEEELIRSLSRYTPKATDPIYSFGRSLFVKFKSGPEFVSSYYTGFLAYYSAVDAGENNIYGYYNKCFHLLVLCVPNRFLYLGHSIFPFHVCLPEKDSQENDSLFFYFSPFLSIPLFPKLSIVLSIHPPFSLPGFFPAMYLYRQRTL